LILSGAAVFGATNSAAEANALRFWEPWLGGFYLGARFLLFSDKQNLDETVAIK
jgi:hypothetical protein